MEGYFNDLEMYDTQMVRVNSNNTRMDLVGKLL